jgi:hypothetical protein
MVATEGVYIVARVTDEPSNPSSVLSAILFDVWGLFPLLSDEELDEVVRRSEASSVPGFVAEDRRSLHRDFGDLTFVDMLSRTRTYRDLSGGESTWTTVETMEVRGDRLALQRRKAEFADGSEMEWLALTLLSPEMLQQRLVLFDIGDDQAARALIDELHAAHPEPADPQAVEQALGQRRDFAAELRERAARRNTANE